MKIQSPWMGRIRGSAGQMTGCKVYDKNVMRAKAFEVSNPNTPAQQTQRAFFASLTALCADFSDEQLRTLFPQKPKTMSRRNAITKQIAANNTMSGSDKIIDFSKIDTLGNASVMDFGTTTCAFANDEIAVELDNSITSNTNYQNSYFIVVVVNETKGEIILPLDSDTVEVGELTLAIPSNWELTDSIHAIPFITDAKTVPVGFGTMSVTKRPVHKES